MRCLFASLAPVGYAASEDRVLLMAGASDAATHAGVAGPLPCVREPGRCPRLCSLRSQPRSGGTCAAWSHGPPTSKASPPVATKNGCPGPFGRVVVQNGPPGHNLATAQVQRVWRSSPRRCHPSRRLRRLTAAVTCAAYPLPCHCPARRVGCSPPRLFGVARLCANPSPRLGLSFIHSLHDRVHHAGAANHLDTRASSAPVRTALYLGQVVLGRNDMLIPHAPTMYPHPLTPLRSAAACRASRIILSASLGDILTRSSRISRDRFAFALGSRYISFAVFVATVPPGHNRVTVWTAPVRQVVNVGGYATVGAG